MKFRLSNLMLLVTLCCCLLAVFVYEYGNVVVLDGSYQVPVTLKNQLMEETTFVGYALIDESQVDVMLDDFAAHETQFHEIFGDSTSIKVVASYQVSPILGRDLGYHRSFDCIVFRIEYAAGETAVIVERDWWRARDVEIEIDVKQVVERSRNGSPLSTLNVKNREK